MAFKHITPSTVGNLPQQLTYVLNHIILSTKLKMLGKPSKESEGTKYGACQFNVEEKIIAFRVAKITPTKIGQFVTVWKRPNPVSVIAPFDEQDPIDFIMIYASENKHCGLFVFNKKILVQKGVMSVNNQGGKRGIRVYPPWAITTAKQAIQTQKWQLEYFLPINANHLFDINLLLKLLIA